MSKLFLITEEEKNRILNLHQIANSRQYLPEANIKKGTSGDPYEYMEKNGKYYFRNYKKGETKWIEAKNNQGKSIEKNIFKVKSNNTTTTDNGDKEIVLNNIKEASPQLSKQVKKQLNYMVNNGFLYDDRFTILDDRMSEVYAFDENYKLYKKYRVITGKNRGDLLTTQNITDYVRSNFDVLSKATGQKDLDSMGNYVKSKYLNKVLYNKNTPSGVFKRAGVIFNFLNDLLLTNFFEETYGAKYITWETLDGKIIPFGFHGTESKTRVDILDNKNSSASNRKVSYGCINFSEKDVRDINGFINSGQITIWLPDNGGIVELPDSLKDSFFGRIKKAVSSWLT
jgi:hypothetical protein